MKKKKKLKGIFGNRIPMLLLLITVVCFATNAQINITGKVLDKQREPLPGVSVTIKGTTTGTLTGIDGDYSITVPNAKSVLVFSFVGFQKYEILVSTQKVVNVTLGELTTDLDEIVVVGYGVQKKSDLTGGITSISADQINNIPAVNLSQRLQGQVAGLNITASNARPGEDGKILIRGKKTLSGSTSPLIVLDGIPFAGSMSEIDQNSIENISILKDASSAAIYGARATNGVILITSRKGAVGKPIVRYNGYIGFQEAQRLPKLLNGEQYVQFFKDYRKDTGDAKWDDPEAYFQTAIVENYRNGKTTDWVDYMFKKGMQMEHQLSVSGATDATNYYVSFSYSDQESIIKEAKGYKKYAVTSNLSQNIGNWLKLGANIQLSERNRGGIEPKFSYGYRMSPYASIKDEKGDYIRYPMYGETMYYSPYAEYGASKDDKTRTAYLNGFLQIDIPWVKGLSYRANIGYSFRHRNQGTYYPTTTMTGSAANGKAIVQENNYGGWTWENVVTYSNAWGKHSLNVTGLYSAEKQYENEDRTEAQDFVSDANGYHNLALAKGLKKITSDDKRKQLLAWMGRINYSFDKRYLLTLTGRRDGSSVYGKDQKWEFFPSVAAGWVITEEPFFKNLDLNEIEYLKLRVSYGTNGNIYSDPYKSYSALIDQDYIFGNDNTLAGGLISDFKYGNAFLTWEKTKTFNLGLDFYLFNNSRLRGTVDYYNSKTSNLLTTRTVPVMNGYTSIEDNVGEIQNQGVEITLNTVNIKTNNFQWNTTITLTGNWDKINDLQRDANGNKLNDVTNKWFIGQPVNVFYDYKVVGIWQENERDEALKYKAIPGDAKLLDANNDGKITSDDRVVIGSKSPRWMLGFTNTFSYRNLSLSLFFNGVFGAWHQNETIKFERQLFDKNVNYLSDIAYWTVENPSNKYTRLGYKDSRHNFYKKVNYIRLQDVNLSYQFPASILQAVGIKGLTTYITARNLFTLSNANKYTTNIEQEIYSMDNTASANSNGYPPQRTFIFGVNLTF